MTKKRAKKVSTSPEADLNPELLIVLLKKMGI